MLPKQTMPIVIIESPYAGDIDENTKYARKCMADCLQRGEAPYASHLLYTQPEVLNDGIPTERELGIMAGFQFKHIPYAITAFYIDLGWTPGMKKALSYCREHGLQYVVRRFKGCDMGKVGKPQQTWPDSSRMDVIGQNGNTGEHYETTEKGN